MLPVDLGNDITRITPCNSDSRHWIERQTSHHKIWAMGTVCSEAKDTCCVNTTTYLEARFQGVQLLQLVDGSSARFHALNALRQLAQLCILLCQQHLYATAAK